MQMFPRVCACVLAAGESKRMGACKLLLPFAGSTLLERALDAAIGCAAEGVAVVTGAYRSEMAATIACAGVEEVHNPSWGNGQASSVKTAVCHASSEGFDAVLLMVADQPFVTASHLDALLTEYDAGRARAYLSANGNRCGNPCLFDERCFSSLMKLEGDEGARSLFRRDSDFPVRYIYFDDIDLFEDVDTPQDLARLEAFVREGREAHRV